jgi:L-malate glycosyltransferase
MRRPDLRKLVFTWLSTGPGGAEESSRLLASAIAERYELEVCLICWKHFDGPAPIRPVSDKVRYFECHSRAAYLHTLSQCLAGCPADTVLFSNHRSARLDLALARRQQAKCGIIFRMLIRPEESIRLVPAETGPDLKYLAWRELDWPFLAGAEAFIGVSQAVVQSLKQFLPESDKLQPIYNIVPDDWFGAAPLKEHAPPRRFLIASRLVAWKSLSTALDAFAKLAVEFPAVRLDVIGDGPELAALQQQTRHNGLSQRIAFHGWQHNPQEWYRASDCLLHASAREGFGRVVAEALASGLPVIGAQAGGVGELILDGHNGFTFEPGCVESCYRALQRFMRLSAEHRQAISVRASVHARSLFNSHSIAAQYVNLASRLIHQSAASALGNYAEATPWRL